MVDFMRRWDSVGGSLAVAKDGRLVFAHSYGLADIEAQQPVVPESIFRVGSISKVVTAVAILTLVEQGKLDLDAPAFALIPHLQPPAGTTVDPRLARITLRHLLTHTAGWDAAKSGDPISVGAGYAIASALGVPAPPDAEALVRSMFTRPLDFDPGSRAVYSNVGFIVLGRIIEAVSGQAYEDFVRESVLQPMGITRMRLGHTRPSERAPGEVRYYDYPRTALVRSAFPEDRGLVAHAYSGHIEADDGSGGWLAAPADIVRLATLLDGQRQPAFFKPETVREMLARPSIFPADSWWFGLGWVVWQEDGGLTWNKNGSYASDQTTLYRYDSGLCWAASFSRHPAEGPAFLVDIGNGIKTTLAEVTAWPEGDLSPVFFSESHASLE